MKRSLLLAPCPCHRWDCSMQINVCTSFLTLETAEHTAGLLWNDDWATSQTLSVEVEAGLIRAFFIYICLQQHVRTNAWTSLFERIYITILLGLRHNQRWGWRVPINMWTSFCTVATAHNTRCIVTWKMILQYISPWWTTFGKCFWVCPSMFS